MNFPLPEQLDMDTLDILARWRICKKKWVHYQAAT